MKTRYLISVLVISAVLVGSYLVYAKITKQKLTDAKNNVASYEECVAQNNIIQTIYPSICITPNGKSFTQDIGNELEKTDLITIDNPRPNATITSPLNITGKARGTWFFEASFPVKLYDGNNKLIAQGAAQAQGDWMTDNFVAYKLTLTFKKPSTAKGLLVLEKDNPSDLAKNDDELRVPINF